MTLAIKNQTNIFDIKKLDVIELAEIDSDGKNSETLRRRDSGYSYPKPDRVRSRFQGRYTMRLPSNAIKPFNTYGPPKQTSLHLFIKPSQHRRPQNQQHRNKYSTDNIRFLHNSPTANTKFEIPSPIRVADFVTSSPIASQNDEPFKQNTANYLPPKNQKVPTHSTLSQYSTQRFNSNINSQSENLIRKPSQNPQISDAAAFLIQHARAISQLYETPATNINYEPLNDSQGSNNQNLNSQFQTFDINSSTQSQELQTSREFARPLPAYSSGYLETYQTTEQFRAMERDKLIAQLQHSLATQDSSRYAQNHGNILENTKKLLSSIATSSVDKPNDFTNRDVTYPTANIAAGLIHPTSYDVSASGLTMPHTSLTTFSETASQRPTEPAGTGTLPTGAPTFQFPQYGGFAPTLIAGTNFVTGLPNYPSPPYSIGQNSGSPTHFGIPIPTTSDNKPPNPTGPSSIAPSAKPSIIPTAGHPLLFPSHPVQPRPIHATPVHPIFPIVPAITSTAGHPTYVIQPTSVNSGVLRPIKPVYPVYYYPNIVHPIQKPSLSTFPWNYAPSYAQTKPAPIW